MTSLFERGIAVRLQPEMLPIAGEQLGHVIDGLEQDRRAAVHFGGRRGSRCRKELHAAIGIGATAALIGSMMANLENSAVASVRSSSSASEGPSAESLLLS